MKLILIQPDGMADEPQADLGDKTPVEAAHTPNMDKLAALGTFGLVHTIPEGFPPGSDIGNLVLLGHNPSEVFTGRAPLEAAANNIDTTEDDVVYRVNFVCITDGVMIDFTAGHISDAEGKQLVDALNAEAPDGLVYHAGVSYRNLAVWANGQTPTQAEPPHNITDQSIDGHAAQPNDVAAEMQRAATILASHPVNIARAKQGLPQATNVWFWGEGKTPTLQTIQSMYGLTGAMITAVDLLRGIAKLSGMEVHDVEGATGFIDTNYAGKCQKAIDTLATLDWAFVHIEAPDESAHMGRTDYKVRSIEDIDAQIVGPLIRIAQQHGDMAIVVLPDHPTLLRTKTHDDAAVPCSVIYPEQLASEQKLDRIFSERSEPDFVLPNGWELVKRVMDRKLPC